MYLMLLDEAENKAKEAIKIFCFQYSLYLRSIVDLSDPSVGT